MKIINELASSAVKNNKKDSFATRISILLAVVLLGSIIFDISFMQEDSYNHIVSTIGDYHVSLSEINEETYHLLKSNQHIKKISFDRVIETDLKATIDEKGKYYWNLEGFQTSKGRVPSKQGELIAPERFLNKNRDLTIGSQIEVKGKKYTIVGTYDDYGYTFEDSMLIGRLGDDRKETLFEDNTSVIAYIWFENPRDTYTVTKEIFKEMNIDLKNAESTGRLFFNKDILEYKMIYPSGIIPPSNVISETFETYGPLFILSLLFAVMIYGAFNVWNNRDVREIALLKSVGMTEKQIKKMIRLKSFRLSVIPVISGTILSYFVANLIIYLIWLNNSISYGNLSNIWGETLRAPDFRMINISLFPIVIILLLSFITVYLSAMLPSKHSAKMSVMDGLNNISERKVQFGKSKISGRIEVSLAKDYFKSYKSTYRTIIIAMSISALVITLVLVSQSHRTLIESYDRYKSPYNFTSKIYTEAALDKNLLEDLRRVKDIKELHIYQHKDFKFFVSDNKGFLSNELQEALNNNSKDEEKLYVRIYGLSDGDFDTLLKENGYNGKISYLMMNKIPADNRTPYAFRNYIPISSNENKKINLKYHAEGKVMTISIDGFINEMPYDLSGYEKNGIFIFTKNSTLDNFIGKNEKDQSDPINYYTIKIKANDDSNNVYEECEKIISSYIPKSDYSTMTNLLKASIIKEQTRNENILSAGIQFVLLIIALSNAYNSFHGNLRARKREFQILSTVGMTEKQMKTMVFSESKILLIKTLILYIGVLALAIIIRAYKSNFDVGFAVRELLVNLNYFPIVIIFIVMGTGIIFAIQNGIKNILEEDYNEEVK